MTPDLLALIPELPELYVRPMSKPGPQVDGARVAKILRTLAAFSDENNEAVCPTQQLSAITQVPRGAIIRALRTVRKLGLLHVKPRKGLELHYDLSPLVKRLEEFRTNRATDNQHA